MDIGADMIVMVKTNKKGFFKETIENLTKDWWIGYDLELSSKPIIMRRSFSIILLQRTQGAQRKLLHIYLSA